MTHKSLLPLALILICPMIFSGCSSQSKDYLYSDSTKLASEADSYFQYKSSTHVDGPDYTCNIKRFSGMETIWRYEAPSDTTLSGACDFLVLKGDVKLVLITPDDEVITVLEQTEMSTSQGVTAIELPVKQGLNRLKLVAKNKAEVSMALDLSAGRAE